jgi:Ca2+-binding RTX toxin-like protein
MPEGGSGDDILIAGSGKSQLEGKGGDTILIAGTTAYDNILQALISILDEWSRTDESYLQRVANLQNSPVNGVSPNGKGLNGPYVLNASTVHASGAGDQLNGGPGMDWFFANLDGIGNNGVKDHLGGSRPEEVTTKITL